MNQFEWMQTIISQHPGLFSLLILWISVWKGIALWKAASKKQMPWFVVLLVVNTAGVLEILYIFIFSQWKKEKTTETQSTGGEKK